MFKYGSFRNFCLKVSFGIFFIIASSIYILSLYSFNLDDPGFNKLLDSSSDYKVANFFGYFGAYLSSYSIVLLGILSYLLGFYFFINGTRLLLGIETNLLFIKLIINLLGLILINASFQGIKFIDIETGVFSDFIFNVFFKNVDDYINNEILIGLFYFIFLILGIIFVFYSYSLKFNFLRKILSTLKILKYLKFLSFIFVIFRFFKKSKSINKRRLKNEPTIGKATSKGAGFTTNIVKKRMQEPAEQFKYRLPSIDLLNKSSNKYSAKKEMSRINDDAAEKLEKTLDEYGVEGKIIGYKTGPIVTLFEFIPNAGVKSSKVIGLSDDIARAMSSISSRISSQPGKNSLGIEIPNTRRENVLLGDVLIEESFFEKTDSLTLALGKDISGEIIFADLEKMPHLLIAGTTGSGKSVGINTMILSILFKFKPDECKLILIDPKMLELSVYEDIPHLLTPVVTDPKKAVFALKWVVREMENRYKLMSSINVKNIESYNNKVLSTLSSGRKLFKEVQTGIDNDTRMPIYEKKEIKLEKLPFIVVVIDEMADLMMVAGKEVETLVQRLAQMARASGIHLITATQRPSVDVITGTIKANFPSRISYKVASKFDSRTILNEMGAEQLLGSGDMLLLENGGNIKRLHGGFVSETEVEKVVKSIKQQATFDHKKEISLEESSSLYDQKNDLISNNNDELYNKAVEIILKQQKVSTSYIQRYLQIGYNRAARIVEKMEEDGIITEANNAGKRHVLKKN